ncbi:MAG: sulfatase-like hydrolase/transferase [Clostridia bacterium]|nr:sulfatase-like hydrolase/transferase [Clostridia bacterium]
MNILLINADQLRHDCVGYRGLRPVKTPNLDALAREGVVYENAFAPLPVCSPARQSLLCGRRADYFGAQWNYDFMPTPELDPDTCWPMELSKAGRRLGYVGRFHVSPTKKPFDFGFTDFINLKDYNAEIAKLYPDVRYTGGWLGCESPLPLEMNRTHWQAQKAGELLESYLSQDKPWLLWVDFEEPHLPCRPSAPFSRMYDPKDIVPWDGWGDTFENKPYIHKQQTLSWNTDTLTWDDFAPMVARYYGCISQIDDAIGRILDVLNASPAKDDTMVIFTSDHGDMCGSHSMLDKHYVLYDDIIRVPLIVKKPGVPHAVLKGNVMNVLDIAATVRRETGLAPDELGHGRPLPENAEEDAKCPAEVLVTSNGQQFGLYTTRCIRTDRYKYVWNLTDTDELYDLLTDPGEKNNLIGVKAHSETVKSLRRRLYELLTETGDRFVKSEWIQRQLLEDKKLTGRN